MRRFLQTALQMCLMKKNPQDLPYGIYYPPLLVILLISISAMIDAQVPVKHNPPILIELEAIGAHLLMIALYLAVVGYGARIVQTLTAVLSVDCFVNLVMFLFILVFYPLELTVIIVFSSFFMYCWRLTLLVNIFREATNSDTTKAILITVTYEVLRIIIIVSLYQQVVT